MDFTLDCEFNGYNGRLLSLALYNPEHSLYLKVLHSDEFAYTDWVLQNVVPLLDRKPVYPEGHELFSVEVFPQQIPATLQEFFLNVAKSTKRPQIHTDWPDDVKYFSELLLTGPGTMIDIPGVDFHVHRVDAYPNDVEYALQHHAWWDALCLFKCLDERSRALYIKARDENAAIGMLTGGKPKLPARLRLVWE